MSKKIILTLSIIIIVLLAVFIGLRSSSNKNRDSSVAQFDLPTYAKAGPYQVGMQNLSMQPANSLEITVWYPVGIDPAEIQETINPYKVKLGKPFGSVTIASAFGFSIKDAG
jgi:hypothetical protein